jgi:putative peptidoglycan lipid II flippase
MGVAVLISRLLGLVREQVFAAGLGAGWASDAYQVAFRVPNLLRDLLAEGALAQAFTAVLAKTTTDAERQRIVRSVQIASIWVLGAIAVLILIFAPQIVGTLAPGLAQGPGYELATQLTRLFSPFLYLVSAAATAQGLLNVLGIFFVPALGAAAFNLGNILVGASLAWIMRSHGLGASAWGFGIGTLVGAVAMWAVQWPDMLKRGYRPWGGLRSIGHWQACREAFRDPGMRKILWLMGPAILSIATIPVLSFIATSYASRAGEGAVSWLNYAYRLVHFPMGVFGVALSTAALPQLSSLIRDKKNDLFEKTLEEGVSLSMILSIGSAFGLAVFGEPLVQLIYQRGHFHSADTLETAKALSAYAWGLPAFVIGKMFVQAFYALDRVIVPATVSFVSIGLNLLLNESLAGRWGAAGVALSTAVTSTSVCLVLATILRLQGVSFVRGYFVRALGVSLLGGMGILFLDAQFGLRAWLVSQITAHGSLLGAVCVLAVVGAVGTLYLSVIALLIPQGRVLLAKIYRKIF